MLCEELLPLAYADLIKALQSPPPSAAALLAGRAPGQLANRLWPRLAALPPHWAPMAKRLYQIPDNV